MPWSTVNVPENVSNLAPELIQKWVMVANRALIEGYEESQAIAIAWSVVNRMQTSAGGSDCYCEPTPVVYWQYPLSKPGTYVAAVGGEFELTPDSIVCLQKAIEILYNLGQPVTLIEGHGSCYQIGTIPASMIDEDDVLRGCLVYDEWYDAGIRSGAYGFSVEAVLNYADPTYTNNEVFEIWPTAWALCPAGVMVAVPPGEPLEVAASQCDHACKGCGKHRRSVRLFAKAPEGATEPTLKGAGMTDLEKLQKRFDDLETSVKDNTQEVEDLRADNDKLKTDLETVTKERDDLAAAKAAEDEAAIAAEVKEQTEPILARALEANREGMTADLKACADDSARKTLLANWDKALPTAPKGKSKEKLGAGEEQSPADELAASQADVVEARKLQAEHGISYTEAVRRVDEANELKG